MGTDKDGENILQATLSVSQAQPWHEGKYQCNRLHPNYHFLEVVVNSERKDLHRHRQREHHGKLKTTTTIGAEMDIVATELTTLRPETTQDLDTEDGTTSEIGNDDVDSQIDAGTTTKADDEVGERWAEEEEEEEGEEENEGKLKMEEIEVEETVYNGIDDDLVLDMDDGKNERKIEMENVQVNELVEHGNEMEMSVTIEVDEDDFEELSTLSTTHVTVRASESDVWKVTGNDGEIGAREIFTEATVQKDKQPEKIVKGERLIIIKTTSNACIGYFLAQELLLVFTRRVGGRGEVLSKNLTESFFKDLELRRALYHLKYCRTVWES